jgi:hypothetical protein
MVLDERSASTPESLRGYRTGPALTMYRVGPSVKGSTMVVLCCALTDFARLAIQHALTEAKRAVRTSILGSPSVLIVLPLTETERRIQLRESCCDGVFRLTRDAHILT